jgi:Zn-dependent protease
MDYSLIQQIALFAIPVILAVTLHEAAHGFVALHFGDTTAKDAGRVTLNPLRHVDAFGTVVLPLLLVMSNAGFVFGYAKPVPVNFAALRNPRWDMLWVAIAGPGMNILLAVISAVLLYAVMASEAGTTEFVANMLLTSIQINVVLAIFNMLPLPPLDGSKVLAAFLPGFLARPYLRLERWGMIILLLLLIVVPILSARNGFGFDIFGPLVVQPAGWVTRLLLSLVGGG